MSKSKFLYALIGLAILAAAPAWGQEGGDVGGGADSVPFFRATAAQGLARTKLSQSTTCLQNLHSLELAGAQFATDYNDVWPASWASFTNYIGDPKLLYCPADTVHPAQTNWASVDFASLSYELVTPGFKDDGSGPVFARCRVHGNSVRFRSSPQAARPYAAQVFPVAAVGSLVPSATALGAAREANVSQRCVNQLKQIWLAAQLYSLDNRDILPASISELTNTLYSPSSLICPADPFTPVPADFGEVDLAAVTYLILAPGANGGDPAQPYARCRIHGHVVDTYGAVSTGTNRYPPRLIVGHPLSQTIEPTHPGSLSVTTGDAALGPFQFQWRRVQPIDAQGEPFTNTVVIEGATNQTYAIPAAQAGDEGYYDVIVRDAQGGYQLSATAYVRVEPLSNVLAEPGWQTNVCASNLRQIRLAARLEGAPSRTHPDTLAALPQYLGWPLPLYCPSDPHYTLLGTLPPDDPEPTNSLALIPPTEPRRSVPTAWDKVTFDATSYLLCQGVPYDATNRVLATCKIHGFQVQADGTLRLSDTEPLSPRLEVQLSGTPTTLVLTLRGLPGTVCAVETSIDLASWVGVTTNLIADGTLHMTNTAWQAAGSQYYRASVR